MSDQAKKHQHTGGPWQQKSDFNRDDMLTIIGNVDGEYVDGVPHCTYTAICQIEDNDEAVANAHLIVAAPDLAAFIRTIANMTQDGESLADAIFFTMKPEDAVQTVNLLIDQARKLEKKAGLA